jgi:dTDP-4-dehydrorhamnose 3,5-epimerase
MEFVPTDIEGVVIIKPAGAADARGTFFRAFDAPDYALHGLPFSVVQAALSHNGRRGTTRGLHYQASPTPEAKVVGCVRGAIFDVAVDLRPGSPTRGRHVAVTLDGKDLLHVPPGVAHGFQTLEDECIVSYLISAPYHAELQRGVRWNDPTLAIPWPITDGVLLSTRDRELPFFRELQAELDDV